MKFQGFVGPAYTLDSTSVDAQSAINIYPEVIESGSGKEGRTLYYRSTPGLEQFATIGSSAIRCIHIDAIGRTLIVSGTGLYRFSQRSEWDLSVYGFTTGDMTVLQGSGINTGTDVLTASTTGDYTGNRVRVSSSGTLPTGLLADTDYYLIIDSGSTFRLASSLANASAGTQVDITAVGSGNLTVSTQVRSGYVELKYVNAINFTTNVLTYTSHGFFDGDRVFVDTFGTPLPGNLSSSLTAYYVIRVDADNFKLATSISNVLSDTEIDLTSQSDEWISQQIGTFVSSTGKVKAASNSLTGDGTVGSSTMFVDGVNNYVLFDNFNTSSPYSFLSPADNEPFRIASFAPSDITWIDGYFILSEAETGKFYVSDLQSIDIDALSFSSSEGDPDVILALESNHRDLWVFNEKTTEIFVNTGNADFPFERIQGGFLEVGCLAGNSVGKIDGTILWLGRSKDGQGIVYAARGPTPQRVSTHAIEQAIAGYSDPSSATSYTYQSKGHKFFVLNFTEATWVFDLSTGLWHQRAFTSSGNLLRNLSEEHAFHYPTGKHFVSDQTTNKIYELKDSAKSDAGAEITRLRSSPYISADLDRVYCSSFQLDMEVGIGLDGGVQGSEPTVMLDYSDDNGKTWSSESFALADGSGGQIGQYDTRVLWRRLGSFRTRIFRVKITDPVDVVFIGAHLDVSKGAS